MIFQVEIKIEIINIYNDHYLINPLKKIFFKTFLILSYITNFKVRIRK